MEHLKQELEKESDKKIVHKLNKPNPSNKDLADIMKHVIDHLWSEERLAQYIYKVVAQKCESCPHKVALAAPAADDGEKREEKISGKLLALVGSLAAAVVALAGMVVKQALR